MSELPLEISGEKKTKNEAYPMHLLKVYVWLF